MFRNSTGIRQLFTFLCLGLETRRWYEASTDGKACLGEETDGPPGRLAERVSYREGSYCVHETVSRSVQEIFPGIVLYSGYNSIVERMV